MTKSFETFLDRIRRGAPVLGLCVALALPGVARAADEDFSLDFFFEYGVTHLAGVDGNALFGAFYGAEDAEVVTESFVLQAEGWGVTEASATLHQSAVGNVISQEFANNQTSIEGSFLNGAGIFGVNQSAGDANNQANVHAIAVGNAGLAAINIDLKFEIRDNDATISNSVMQNRIVDSFNDMVGIVGVNQVAGNFNLQANVVVMALGAFQPADFGVAMTDVTLGAVTGGNSADVDEATTLASGNEMTGSFDNFTGIAQVNQTAGNGNISAKIVGITYNVVN